MLEIIFYLKSLVAPIIVPVCFISAWGLLFLGSWSVITGVKEINQRVQEMHQIPCTNCQFFVNDHRLKCTVRPAIANTEEAINCYDYQKLR